MANTRSLSRVEAPEHQGTMPLPFPDEAATDASRPRGPRWVSRDDLGDDGLRRWERDDIERYLNTRDPEFLREVLAHGSAAARRRASAAKRAHPPLGAPPPRESARRMDAGTRAELVSLVDELRRRDAARRAA